MSATTGRSAARHRRRAAYFYSPDRGGEHSAAHLPNIRGFLQADAHSGFAALHER